MKRSISPDPFSSATSPKLVHHSPDDDISYRLPFTYSDENLFCLPVSVEREPPALFDVHPVPVKGTFSIWDFISFVWFVVDTLNFISSI